MQDTKSAWHDTLEIIKVSVSPAIFSTWFSQTHPIKIDEINQRFLVEIGCPTSYIKNFVETRYFGLIQDSATKVLGKPCDLTFTVKENPEKGRGENKSPSPLFETGETDEEFTQALQKARIRANFTFENFAVSGSNQMATLQLWPFQKI